METADHDAAMLAYYGERAPLMRYENLDAGAAATLEAYAVFIGEKLRDRRVLEVACGTGFWTQGLARRASAVFATDAVPEMLAQARSRHYERANVTLSLADAFTLEGVPAGWSGGFHVQWFSHVQRARVGEFMAAFHRKLSPGAVVVFGDNKDRGSDPDSDGNLYQQRTLPSGSSYRIIKNWPSEEELCALLQPYAADVEVRHFERDWFVSYRLRT